MESCQFCPYLNKDPTKLARHVKGVHLQIRNLECDRCDYKASEKGTLKLHIKAAHDKTMPDKVRDRDMLKCNQCEYTVQPYRVGHLNYHKKTVHDKVKNYKCDKCSY